MVNAILKRELKSNKKGHKLFDNQKPSDLNELVENKEFHSKDDLYIDFNVKAWNIDRERIYESYDKEEQLKRCQQYVALRILEQLQKRNKELEEYEVYKYLFTFRYDSEDEYKKVENKFLGVNDVIDLLSFEENQVQRIHFIMNGNKNNLLCDALTPFLAKGLPFSTSIYTSPNGFYSTLIPGITEKKYIWEEYEYTRFIEHNEGEKNIPKKKRTNKVKEKTTSAKIS